MTGQMDILVVGGGPAGLMAAIIAAREGAKVRIAERMPRVGKKLLATGAGRCNLCNVLAETKNYHGADTSFMLPALDAFGAGHTLAFFEALGVDAQEAENGRVFPVTGQAANVLDVLRYEAERLGIVEICGVKVQRVMPGGGGFRCFCLDAEDLRCGRLILATGGKSSPNLGSNGGGYKLAQALGHRVTPVFPARVQLTLDAWFLKRLKGVKITGTAEVLIDGQCRRRDKGDLLFTDYGISGPPILQISRHISENEDRGLPMHVRLDLYPDDSLDALARRIRKRFHHDPAKPLGVTFIGMFHKRLIPVVLKDARIEDPEQPCGTVTEEQVQRIAALLKGWTLRCTGTKSWMSSQVTAGGVDVRGVNPRTMESKRVPGLYFAGELLDIDGDCGGYNLQWSWSSGYLAGQSAARGA